MGGTRETKRPCCRDTEVMVTYGRYTTGATYWSHTGTGMGLISTDRLSGEGSDGDKVRSLEKVKHERGVSRWRAA